MFGIAYKYVVVTFIVQPKHESKSQCDKLYIVLSLKKIGLDVINYILFCQKKKKIGLDLIRIHAERFYLFFKFMEIKLLIKITQVC